MSKIDKSLFFTSILIFLFFGFVFYDFYTNQPIIIPILTSPKISPPLSPPLIEKELTLGNLDKLDKTDKALLEKFLDDFSVFLVQRTNNYNIPKQLRLVNLVHILKEKERFKIDCFFGPAYNDSNLQLFYPQELISVGRVTECTERVAILIDKIAKTPERNCLLPLAKPIPLDLEDYYLIVLAWNIEELDQKNAKQLAEIEPNPQCATKFQELVGNKIAIGVKVGILDKKNSVFYP